MILHDAVHWLFNMCPVRIKEHIFALAKVLVWINSHLLPRHFHWVWLVRLCYTQVPLYMYMYMYFSVNEHLQTLEYMIKFGNLNWLIFFVYFLVPPEPYFQLFTIARGHYNITIGWNLSGISSNSINVSTAILHWAY